MGLDLSMTLPQPSVYQFVSSGTRQGYEAPLEQNITDSVSSYCSRPPMIPTLSSLMSPIEYSLQLGTNLPSMAGPLEGQTFFDLAPSYSLLEDVCDASSSQIQSAEPGHSDIEDMLVSGSRSLGQELTRLLDDTADILNYYEEGPNNQPYLGSPDATADRQTSDLSFDTLLSEFQPSLPSSGSITPRNKRSRPLRPAPARQRDTPKKKKAVKRRADKENSTTM